MGYEGTAELDMSRGICRGKILFIKDLVTYQSDTPAKLEKEFQEAVDDYLETCTQLSRKPAMPFRGQFNVRIPPDLHRSATLRAIEDGISLNDVVVRALDSYLCASSEVNHHLHLTISGAQMAEVTSVSSDEPKWNVSYAH
jgi:predicted HicB family RNase H-like nuclease